MTENNQKKVLIIEPNAYHNEVIPGFVDYFLQMGYRVDCLMHQDSSKLGDVFCRCPALKEKIRVYTFDGVHAADRIAELKKENGYTLLFFNSFEIKNDVCREAVERAEPLFENEQGMMACIHMLHMSETERSARARYFKNRMVALSATKISYGVAEEVNPNFFCDTEPKRALHEPVTFLSVGRSQNQNELLRAADRIYKKSGKAPRLVFVRKQENWKDALLHLVKFAVIEVFRLKMLDSSLHRPLGRIDPKVKNNAEVTGRVSFAELYDRVEAADFIVLNFYQGCEQETGGYQSGKNTFTSIQTSGSKQLSLGFLIPCIVEKKAADYYGFSEKNAVIYEDGQLEEALERASRMSAEEYADMVAELKKLQGDIRARSLSNLERMLCKA